MYLSFYPIGTSGHRASALVGFVPYQNYGAPSYGNVNGCFQQLPIHSQPPQYMQPPSLPVYNAPYAPLNPKRAFTNNNVNAGGISAVLEYEPAEMAAFICWCLYGMLGQSRTPTKEFESSIVSILNATRLPKSTIIIALEYVNQRFSSTVLTSMSDLEVFLKLLVALVLANKFNDDNTFTNKSWSGASGVQISVLNSLEKAWLAAVNWNLSVVKFQANIETLEECWTSWLQKQAVHPWTSGANIGISAGASPVLNQGQGGSQGSGFSHIPSYSHSGSVLASDSYASFSSVPSSPVYDTYGSMNGGSMYNGYSSPINESPVKFPQDWSVSAAQNFQFNPRATLFAPYVPQQSIWAYPQSNLHQAMPPRMDMAFSGFANPYYSCLATY